MIVFHETQTDSPDSPCVHVQDLSDFSVGVDRLDKAQHPCLISTVSAQNHLPLLLFVERTPGSGLEDNESLPLGFLGRYSRFELFAQGDHFSPAKANLLEWGVADERML